MSARRQVDKHIHALREVRDIMNAMKNLALLESRKVSKSLAIQRETSRHLERVGANFLKTHPRPPAPTGAASAIVVLGAERGFCGDYNKRLITTLESQLLKRSEPVGIILVGHRLALSARLSIENVVQIDGATVSEEIADTLSRLANALTNRFTELAPAQVMVIRHSGEASQPVIEPILAHFEPAESDNDTTGVGPELTLEPDEFLAGLVEAYLMARLREMLGAALAAESLYRVQHLNGAIRHLDRRTEELSRRSRMMRQEETIEEIEVLLLGSDLSALQPTRTPHTPRKLR